MKIIHISDLETAYESIPDGEDARKAAMDQLGMCDDCFEAFVHSAAADLIATGPEQGPYAFAAWFLCVGVAAGRKAERDGNS